MVRLDSFAKFLAPGLRLGWVTAAPALVEKLTFCLHGTNLGAGATTQVGFYGVLCALRCRLENGACSVRRSVSNSGR